MTTQNEKKPPFEKKTLAMKRNQQWKNEA